MPNRVRIHAETHAEKDGAFQLAYDALVGERHHFFELLDIKTR